jgi:hypothetical protein
MMLSTGHILEREQKFAVRRVTKNALNNYKVNHGTITSRKLVSRERAWCLKVRSDTASLFNSSGGCTNMCRVQHKRRHV